MPFITNDIKPLVIKKSEWNGNATKYDGYVIVRKLFLSSRTPLAREELNKQFSDCGNFEPIEICKNGIEGYVTFENWAGAYMAWKDVEVEGVKIKPAYSWEQPKLKDESDVETTSKLIK